MLSKTLLQSLLCAALAFSFACAGADGEDGATGADGANGENGKDGAPGASGAVGPQGETGAVGPDGETGAVGPQGETGATGANGTNGADGLCANATPLDITELTGLGEFLYETDSATVQVVTNAAAGATVALSVVGAGLPVSFADNGDSSFSINTGAISSAITDANAIYSVIATDGCTVASETFTLNSIRESAGTFRVVNFTGARVDAKARVVREAGADPVEFTLGSFVGNDAVSTTERTAKTGVASVEIIDYNTDEVLYTLENVQIERDGVYNVVAFKNANDTVGAQVVKLEAPEEGKASVRVTHLASAAPQVDVWNLLTSSVVAADLDPGTSSASVSVDPMDLQVGVDIDNDMTPDAEFSAVLALEAGKRYHAIALGSTLEALRLAVVAIDGSSESVVFTVPFPAPLAANTLTLPYRVNSVANELPAPGYNSFRYISAPAGTVAIQLGLSYRTEGCCDTLFIMDRDLNVLHELSGTSAGTEMFTISGDSFVIALESDFGLQYFYQIESLSFN